MIGVREEKSDGDTKIEVRRCNSIEEKGGRGKGRGDKEGRRRREDQFYRHGPVSASFHDYHHFL